MDRTEKEKLAHDLALYAIAHGCLTSPKRDSVGNKYKYIVYYENGQHEEISAENKKMAKKEAKRLEAAGCCPKIINVRKKY